MSDTVTAPSETIEANLRRQANPSRLVLHLANYTGSHVRPIPQTVPLANVGIALRVTTKPQRVRDVFGERDLAFTYANGTVSFTLAELGTYDVITVE